MKRSRSTYRVSIHIPDRVRAVIGQPELVGLPAGTSAARIYSRLLEYGYDAAVRAVRDGQRLTAAAAYAADPERRRVAPDLQRSGLSALRQP